MVNIAEQNAASYNSQADKWDETFANNVWYKYLERPAMKCLLPQDLEHKSVLCIGVGAGDELEEIVKQNPRRVVAIDISEKFLDITKNKFPSVEVVKMDMMDMDFPDSSFDLVYSSLAFHYSPDWDVFMQKILKVLKPSGKLLFSTHHPSLWGKKEKVGETTNTRGIQLTQHKTTLHTGVEVDFFNHKNTESIVESVEHAGFKVIKALSPEASKNISVPQWEKEEYENLVKRSVEDPILFVVLAAK